MELAPYGHDLEPGAPRGGAGPSSDLDGWARRAAVANPGARAVPGPPRPCGPCGLSARHRAADPAFAFYSAPGVPSHTAPLPSPQRLARTAVAAAWLPAECVVLHSRRHACTVVGVLVGTAGPQIRVADPAGGGDRPRQRLWDAAHRRRYVAWTVTQGIAPPLAPG